jgi:hypothetical protein
MAESTLAVTAGSGSLLHVNTRTIAAQTNIEQYVQLAEPGNATYSIVTAATSIATAASHTLQIMAGSTLPVYIRRIVVYQMGLATAAAIVNWDILRLTTAGTGGTSITPSLMDTQDSASGATAMTLPTVKGTEGVALWRASSSLTQTVATQAAGTENTKILDIDFDMLMRGKPPRIAAGTSNGICLKQVTGAAAATVYVVATISELSY